MALALDASSPAIVTSTSISTTTITSGSFTPPAGSVLHIRWSWNSRAADTPAAPSITDSLGGHLTYTLVDHKTRATAPAVDGQAADWWAVVGSSTAMTVTVTANSTLDHGGSLSIDVWTGADTVTPIGAHGKGGSASAASIAQSFTATATGSWGVIGTTDWDVKGAQTAGTGCTLEGSANVSTSITYGYLRRTTGDGVNGSSTTLNVTLPGTSTNLSWVYAEIMPAGGAASIPPLPTRVAIVRDYGEVQWLQQPRRDANTVGTAANPLPSPLDSAWQSGGLYDHLYKDTATRDRRVFTGWQRNYNDANATGTVGNPAGPPLDTSWQAGGGYWHLYNDTAVRDRRQYFQQRAYVSQPGLLQPAGTYDPLLAASQAGRQRTWPTDRRLVPQQRQYPQALPDVDTVVGVGVVQAWWGVDDNAVYTAQRTYPPVFQAATTTDMGAGAQQWTGADDNSGVQQRQYFGPPQPELSTDVGSAGRAWWSDEVTNHYVAQRQLASDPNLLAPAAPADPLLSAWLPTWLSYNRAGWDVDRREMPQQRPYLSDPSFYPTGAVTDPLTVAWGDGGTYWSLYNTAALQVNRRLIPQQRAYVSDPLLLLTALLESPQLYTLRPQPLPDRRQTVPPPRVFDPSLLATVTDPLTVAGGVGGDTWRRVNTPAYADRREVPQQPPRRTLYFDAGPGSPPLTLAWGAGGDLWHRYNPRRPARSWWPTWAIVAMLGELCSTPRPSTGVTTRPSTGTTAYALATTARPGSGITARPNTGITQEPC